LSWRRNTNEGRIKRARRRTRARQINAVIKPAQWRPQGVRIIAEKRSARVAFFPQLIDCNGQRLGKSD
jgi:hypothetical protein